MMFHYVEEGHHSQLLRFGDAFIDTKKDSCATLWSEGVIVLPSLLSIFTNLPQDLIS